MSTNLFKPYFKKLRQLLEADDGPDQWRVVDVFEGFRTIERKVFLRWLAVLAVDV
jgi:hypothetical protein